MPFYGQFGGGGGSSSQPAPTFEYKGVYAAATTYDEGDVVSSGGKFYVSLADNNTGNAVPVAPATSNAHWAEGNFANVASLLQTLQQADAAEATARSDADTALGVRVDGVSAEITAEETARTNADTAETNARDAAITAEETARDAAITAEANARTAAIGVARDALQDQINDEITARTSGDNAEIAARTDADNAIEARVTALESGLSDEETTRENADNTEKTARENADAAERQARINADDAEVAARQAGDTGLTARIDATDASLAIETQTREHNDADLDNRVAVLEAQPGGGGGGTSTDYIQQAARGVVQDWAEEGNTDDIPLSKLGNVPVGGGGLNQAQVDARIDAEVEAWAHIGDDTQIPSDKLGNVADPGDDGTDGSELVWIFQVAANKPAKPAISLASYNAGTLGDAVLPANIPAAIPAGSKLWASVATLSHATPQSLSAWSEYFPVGGAVEATNAGDVAAAVAWAQAGNTDAIPGAKLKLGGGGVIASAAADISALRLNSIQWSEKEQALYIVREDDHRTDYPLRATVTTLQDLSDTDDHVVRGVARQEIPPLADVDSEIPSGAIALAPNAGGVLKAGVKAILWLSNATGSLGNLIVGMDTALEFVPRTIRIKVGDHTAMWGTLSPIQTIEGVTIYYAGHGYSKQFSNAEVFQLREGQENLTFDFDLVDADGNSFIAPANPTRRLERLPIATPGSPTEPTTPTDAAGGVSYTEPYGSTYTPRASPKHTLVDSDNGDSYFAKEIPETTDRLVEPVRLTDDEIGFGGHGPNAISVETDGLTSVVMNTEKRELAVGMSSAKLATLKSVAYFDSKHPDAPDDDDRKVFAVVPVPAGGTHPQEVLKKHAALKVLSDNSPKSVAVESGPNIQQGGQSKKRYVGDGLTGMQAGDVLHLDRGTRKARSEIDNLNHRDRQQRIVGVAMHFANVGGVAEFESGIAESDAPTQGNWITPYAPPILRGKIKLNGSDESNRNESYVDVPWYYPSSALNSHCLALVIETGVILKPGHEGQQPTTQNVEPYKALNPDPRLIFKLEPTGDQVSVPSRTIWDNRYRFRSVNGSSLPWTSSSRGLRLDEITGWCYVSLVFFNRADEDDWFSCMVPNPYECVLVHGVEIPVKLQSVGWTNRADGLGADFRQKYESEAFDASQDELFKAGETYKVNLRTDLNVYHGKVESDEIVPPRYEASRIALLGADGNSILPAASGQGFWKLRNRAIEPDESIRLDPPHEHQQLLFKGGEFWRALRHEVEGIVFTLHWDNVAQASNQVVWVADGFSRRLVKSPGDGVNAYIDSWVMSAPHQGGNQSVDIYFLGDWRAHYDDMTLEVYRFSDQRTERVEGVRAIRFLDNPIRRASLRWHLDLQNTDYEDGDQIMLKIFNSAGDLLTQKHRALVWYRT